MLTSRENTARFAVSNEGRILRVRSREIVLTGSRCSQLASLLRGLIDHRVSLALIDLRRSSEVDTALLAVLVEARRQARACHVELVILASPALRDLAEVCRLDRILATR